MVALVSGALLAPSMWVLTKTKFGRVLAIARPNFRLADHVLDYLLSNLFPWEDKECFLAGHYLASYCAGVERLAAGNDRCPILAEGGT